jgi:hypothetical protein
MPLSEYVWVGFCNVDETPSPNDHNHDVGEFSEVSVNWTVSGTVPCTTSAVKDASGAIVPLVTVM